MSLPNRLPPVRQRWTGPTRFRNSRSPNPGVRVIETCDNVGMRGTASRDIEFDGVEVPSDALLPSEGSAAPGDGQA
jgi:alkylation response protein AidB-like acyl-CoA dehydrogenase